MHPFGGVHDIPRGPKQWLNSLTGRADSDNDNKAALPLPNNMTITKWRQFENIDPETELQFFKCVSLQTRPFEWEGQLSIIFLLWPIIDVQTFVNQKLINTLSEQPVSHTLIQPIIFQD